MYEGPTEEVDSKSITRVCG